MILLFEIWMSQRPKLKRQFELQQYGETSLSKYQPRKKKNAIVCAGYFDDGKWKNIGGGTGKKTNANQQNI